MTISTGNFDSFGIPQGNRNRMDDLEDVDTAEAKEGNTVNFKGGRWVPVDGNEVAVQATQPQDLGVELWVKHDEVDPPPALDVVTADSRYVNVEGDTMKGPLTWSYIESGDGAVARNPDHGTYHNVAEVTGFILIELPGPITAALNTMAMYKITGYDLGNGAFEVLIGGYMYSSVATPVWYMPVVTFTGSGPQGNTQISTRLLSKGAQGAAYFAIALGDSTTPWLYPMIKVEAMTGYQGVGQAAKKANFSITSTLSGWREDLYDNGSPKMFRSTYPEIQWRKTDGAANERRWTQYISGTAGEVGADAASMSFASENDDRSDQEVIRFFRDGRIVSQRPYSGFTRNTDTNLTADVEYKVVYESQYGLPGNTQQAVTHSTSLGYSVFTIIYEGTYLVELNAALTNTAVKAAPIDFGIREYPSLSQSSVSMTAYNTIANSWSDRLVWTNLQAWPAGYQFFTYFRPVGATGGTGWKTTYIRMVLHRLT